MKLKKQTYKTKGSEMNKISSLISRLPRRSLQAKPGLSYLKKIISLFAVLTAATLFAAPDEVKLSSFGPGKDDATAAFEAAFASGAKKIIVDDPGFDYIVRPLFVPSDTEIVFLDKVVVRAKKDEFKGTNDSLFRIRGQKNVILRGEGTVLLEMNKADYQDKTRYRPAEWRHGIAISGGENVIVKNLTVRSSGGDGIYVSNNKADCPRDILIENVICENHHRQGISVTCAENLIVRNSRFNDTSGTPPACGIDFEPNEARDRLVNILMEDCEFSRNAMSGIFFHLIQLNKEKSLPVSIMIRNCRFDGNRRGLGANIGTVSGEITFDGCSFTESNGESVYFKNAFGNLKFTVRNSLFQDKIGKIEIETDAPRDTGNIFFENVKLITGAAAPVTLDCPEGYGLVNCHFGLLCGETLSSLKEFDSQALMEKYAPNPEQRKSITFVTVEPKKLKAATQSSKDGLGTMNIRGKFRFIQAVPAAGTYPIRFTFKRLGRRDLKGSISVRDQNDTLVDRKEKIIPVNDQYVYELKTNGAGVYIFEVNFGDHCVQLHADHPGQGILADKALPLIWGCNKLYFVVPAEAEEVKAEVAGSSGGEWIHAYLRDSSQKIVDKAVECYSAPRILTVKRTPTEKDEIWTLELHAEEDHRVRLGAPCLPIFYAAPENILIGK